MSTPSGKSVTKSVGDATELVFDRFVRALGILPNDSDERKDAGDGCVGSNCRDGFHGSKACASGAFSSSAESHRNHWDGYDLSHGATFTVNAFWPALTLIEAPGAEFLTSMFSVCTVRLSAM